MRKRAIRAACVAIVLAIVCSAPGYATWVYDGLAISAAANNQVTPTIVSDGAGGAIITWTDGRSGNNDIYAQRVNASGAIVWTANGVALCSATGTQTNPTITSDGAGGAIITWWDLRGNGDIYAQRVNASGAPQWVADGVAISAAANDQAYPTIVSDGTGGAIITWYDNRSGMNLDDIYAQRVNASGTVQWVTDGVAICTADHYQQYPQITADGAGGAIIMWIDSRSGSRDIYAQRVNASGAIVWTANGVALCTATGNHQYPQITSDGAGGAIITWTDGRSGNNDIYAQRVNASGAIVWTANGVALCSATGTQTNPTITSDGAGGAIITWWDLRGNGDIYAQRVNASGAPQWVADGVAISAAANDQAYPTIVSDGTGGAIIAWMDSRSGIYDIYTQKVNASGAAQWTANGIALCTAIGNQAYPTITSDGASGAIIAWQDSRNGNYDIYAQRITIFGIWGCFEPIITAVRDIPEDQGGKVSISWDASQLDVYNAKTITQYSVWRALRAYPEQRIVERGLRLVAETDVTKDFKGPAYRLQQTTLGDFYWEWIGNVDAYYLKGYSFTAPTLYDSTGSDPAMHYFQIIAHTVDRYVFAASPPDSGYSVDNLAPHLPADFIGLGVIVNPPLGLRLIWDHNTDPDISHYVVHKGTTEDFIPDGSNLLASVTNNGYMDGSWTLSDRHFYKLAAVDVHENTGPYALLRPSDIVVGVLLQSYRAALLDNCVELAWSLLGPVPSNAHHILRSSASESRFTELSNAEIAQQGDLNFTCRDASIEPGGTYRYRVEVEESGGNRVLLFETNDLAVPSVPLTLFQNQPNPFNPSTTIRFYLPEPTSVTLGIYDSSGRVVATLIENERRSKGYQEVRWGGTDNRGRGVASGVYFYRLTTGKETKYRKMIVLR